MGFKRSAKSEAWRAHIDKEKNMSKVTCIMLAGGKGKRMGGKVSKQYLLMNDKPVLYYSLKAFEPYVDEIILVAAAGEEDYCRKEVVDKYNIGKVSAIVAGGAERYLSVYEGLKAIGINASNDCHNDYVLIHDGARPFISKDAILRVIDKVKETKACVAAVPSKDTIKIGNADGIVESTPNRSNVWVVQTPQAFEVASIKEAYERAIQSGRDDITDDSMVMESFGQYPVHFVMGEYDNIKLTTPEDMVYGMAILQGKTED